MQLCKINVFYDKEKSYINDGLESKGFTIKYKNICVVSSASIRKELS